MALKCAFCPKSADSGEHLWDAWICRLPMFKNKPSYFREQILPNPQVRVWKAKNLDRKKKTVCEKCNNEWMSDVVNELVKPCIQSMIPSDSVTELSPECVRSIAIYAFLKAVVGDQLKPPNKAHFFSMAVRSYFRRTLLLPPNMQVWLGCIGVNDPHNAIFRMNYGHTAPKAPSGKYLYTFTLGVGRLVIQLASLKLKNPRFRRKIVTLLPPDQFFDGKAYSIPIWPPTGKNVVWPPLNHLSGPFLEAFTNRFARG